MNRSFDGGAFAGSRTHPDETVMRRAARHSSHAHLRCAMLDLAVRVLVVEDEVKLASLIRKGLKEDGLLADVAVKGEDALWMAAATPYDIVVLDINLPGIDGFETLRRLRTKGVRT